jgi:hypothetical protein
MYYYMYICIFIFLIKFFLYVGFFFLTLFVCGHSISVLNK